jgi:hypothetical protein
MSLIARIGWSVVLFGCLVATARVAAWPDPVEGTYVVPEFRFADGETALLDATRR